MMKTKRKRKKKINWGTSMQTPIRLQWSTRCSQRDSNSMSMNLSRKLKSCILKRPIALRIISKKSLKFRMRSNKRKFLKDTTKRGWESNRNSSLNRSRLSTTRWWRSWNKKINVSTLMCFILFVWCSTCRTGQKWYQTY